MSALSLLTEGHLSLFAQALVLLLLFLLGALPLSSLVIRFASSGPHSSEKLRRGDAIELGRELGLWPAGVLVATLHFGRGLVVGYLLLDSVFPVWMGALGISMESAPVGLAWVGGLSLLLGQVYSPFNGFQGGRGFFALMGLFTVFSPWVAVVGMGGALLGYLNARVAEIATLSGLLAAAATHLVLINKGTPEWWGVVLIGLVFYRHRLDVERILQARGP